MYSRSMKGSLRAQGHEISAPLCQRMKDEGRSLDGNDLGIAVLDAGEGR